jgi:predicted nucleic acid-binding protein
LAEGRSIDGREDTTEELSAPLGRSVKVDPEDPHLGSDEIEHQAEEGTAKPEVSEMHDEDRHAGSLRFRRLASSRETEVRDWKNQNHAPTSPKLLPPNCLELPTEFLNAPRNSGTADWNEASPADAAAVDISRLDETFAEVGATESAEQELGGNERSERLAELADIDTNISVPPHVPPLWTAKIRTADMLVLLDIVALAGTAAMLITSDLPLLVLSDLKEVTKIGTAGMLVL